MRDFVLRRRTVAGRLVRLAAEPLRVGIQTSTTTGKTSGRRRVCSYRYAANLVLDLALEKPDLTCPVARALNRSHDVVDRALHEWVAFVPVNEASGNDLRPGDDLASLLVDGDDNG